MAYIPLGKAVKILGINNAESVEVDLSRPKKVHLWDLQKSLRL